MVDKANPGLEESKIVTGIAPPDTYVQSDHTKVFTQLAAAVGINTRTGFKVETFNPKSAEGHRSDLSTAHAPEPQTLIVVQGTPAGQPSSRGSSELDPGTVSQILGREYSDGHANIPVSSPVAVRLLTSLTDAAAKANKHELEVEKKDWGYEQRVVLVKHKGAIVKDGKLLDGDILKYMGQQKDELAQAQQALVVASALQHEMGPIAKLAVDPDDKHHLRVYQFGSSADEAAFGRAMNEAGIEQKRFQERGRKGLISGYVVTIPDDPVQLLVAAASAIGEERSSPGQQLLKKKGPPIPGIERASAIAGDTYEQQRGGEPGAGGGEGFLGRMARRVGRGLGRGGRGGVPQPPQGDND